MGRASAFVVTLFVATLVPASAWADDKPLLDAAKTVRPGVVRIVWRDARFSDLTSKRNAIVVRADGMLLMAGPPPSRRGTLTARFADGAEVRARLIARDTETTLTLLQVDRTKLSVPRFREDGPARAKKDADGALRAAGPLAKMLPPLTLRVAMVTGDGAVAVGPIRAHGRHGAVTDPDTRKPRKTTGLIAAALASIDDDAGSPLIDVDGRIAGLVVGRRDAVDPEDAAAARRRGLRTRTKAVECLAVPASVAQLVWPLLEKHKRVPRVALGVRTKMIDPVLAAHLQLEGGHVIQSLVQAGVGARQGLKAHDVIVSVDGRAIATGTTLHDALLPFRPGSLLTLDVVREGRRVQVPVRTGER